MSSSRDILRQLDESPLSSFHWKTVITSGMGFFTDAYDLFIIGVVISILRPLWHPSALDISLLGSTALISAALGSIVFGRLADMLGRKFVYGYELLVLAAGAIASALSPGITWLLIFRFVLGLGIGGDYPVSATLMSEYSNRHDRGKLITLVFSTQALGLIVGPLIAIILLSSGVNQDLTWRLMLAFGAVPALATFYLRRQIAESPRFALASGNAQGVAEAVARAMQRTYSDNVEKDTGELINKGTPGAPEKQQLSSPQPQKRSLLDLLKTPFFLIWLTGTAGTWFLLDIAYYGTTVSTPIVLKLLNSHGSLITNLFYSLLS